MPNSQYVIPVGREFESLVNLLPPWALTYEHMTIEKVRKALKEYEEVKKAENLHATKTVV